MHVFVFISWTSAAMQSMTSATSCAIEQFKPWFRFQAVHGNLPRALVVGALALLILSILLSCAQAFQSGIGNQPVHINASKSLLIGKKVSPTLSHSAAEAVLNYKGGNWLFADQRSDLEAHVATTSGEERVWSLEWILDSGASCHFCNDASKFVSLTKCNITISTAKKGEQLIAVGIGDCKITI